MQLLGQYALLDFAAHAVLDVQLDIGVLLQDGLGKPADFGGVGGVDEAELGVGFVMFGQGFGEAVEFVVLLQQRFGFGQESFTRQREAHAVGVALKQSDIEIFFDGFDLRGDGRLGKVQLFGGLGEVADVGDYGKGFELVVVHGNNSLNVSLLMKRIRY